MFTRSDLPMDGRLDFSAVRPRPARRRGEDSGGASAQFDVVKRCGNYGEREKKKRSYENLSEAVAIWDEVEEEEEEDQEGRFH